MHHAHGGIKWKNNEKIFPWKKWIKHFLNDNFQIQYGAYRNYEVRRESLLDHSSFTLTIKLQQVSQQIM